VLVGARRTGDPSVLIADASRARHQLAWRPKYPDLSTQVMHAWVGRARAKPGSGCRIGWCRTNQKRVETRASHPVPDAIKIRVIFGIGVVNVCTCWAAAGDPATQGHHSATMRALPSSLQRITQAELSRSLTIVSDERMTTSIESVFGGRKM
jgi:hypothetical protein